MMSGIQVMVFPGIIILILIIQLRIIVQSYLMEKSGFWGEMIRMAPLKEGTLLIMEQVGRH